jgi:hypothetical protein
LKDRRDELELAELSNACPDKANSLTLLGASPKRPRVFAETQQEITARIGEPALDPQGNFASERRAENRDPAWIRSRRFRSP